MQIRFLINFPKKKGFFYPGCQRSSRSPAARSVRVSSAFLAASRLAFVASSLNSVAPSEKKKLLATRVEFLLLVQELVYISIGPFHSAVLNLEVAIT